MKTISVKVQKDHLESLSHVKKPILAIAELVWNGLDANANMVKVMVNRNRLTGIESIVVADDGDGLPYDEALHAFEKLGGSWKKEANSTKGGKRFLHGKAGKGRFRAFYVGKSVRWETWYKSNGRMLTYDITGYSDRLGEFTVGDETLAKRRATGTNVEVREMKKEFRSITGNQAIQEMTEHFSLYMSLYPDVKIVYDGESIDPHKAMESKVEYELDEIQLETGKSVKAQLSIIEWKSPTERKLYLCDSNGFTYHNLPPGIHAPGFNFTAYLKTDLIRELEEVALLMFEDWHPDLKNILEEAKKKLREHFKQRNINLAGKVVERWKEDKIYPYEGEPKDVVEQSERQVFDLCAITLPRYLPDFESADSKSKSLSLKLLRHALETSPSATRRILAEVLDLPEDKQEEFARLLDETSLEAVISASKIVADRLDFLRGLEILIFNPKSKEQLLERKQLHRIIAEHTWIFGEQFNLTIDDKSLTEVLKKHLQLASRDIAIDEPVTREDGSRGIIDLMISRRVPQARAEEREHLIIEIKRPNQKIDSRAAVQIKDYAFAINEDERFRDTLTRWTFWAVSNDVSKNVRKEAKQQNRPEGLLFADDKERLTIWIKTWGQVIEDCRARLNFFQEKLQYSANNKTALEYLHREYEKYLPSCLTNDQIPIHENSTTPQRETSKANKERVQSLFKS